MIVHFVAFSARSGLSYMVTSKLHSYIIHTYISYLLIFSCLCCALWASFLAKASYAKPYTADGA